MFFKKFKNKLLFILFLTIFSIPIYVQAYSSNIVVGGENIGIEIKSKGVLVVGFYKVNNISPGQIAGLTTGDIITSVDDTVINSITDLSEVINNETKQLNITYKRNGKHYKTTINLIRENNIYKTGIYIKDSIIGIGTLTFIDPKTKTFGALGHEIIESSTGLKFEIKNGTIFKSNITNIKKSTRNDPGEKNAKYYINDKYGTITKNHTNGIYGKYEKSIKGKEILPIAQKDELETGTAYIRTVLTGYKVEQYQINIIKINENDETKNILFEVTDEELLNITNGIVQGMSGSPIIQNNKVVGAITHVLTENPKKGYGIFITNMLEEADKQG